MESGSANHPPAWSRYIRRIGRPFLSKAEKARIVAAIAEQEARTTSEIHVHVVAWAGAQDILVQAQKIFANLGLEKTDGRNGVLILISHLDHRFAIYGDEALHARAGQLLWDRAKEKLLGHFAARRYATGIEDCVREIGLTLAEHFPRAGTIKSDQLSNEITEG